MLNDQPLFQLGPLDQGWWPDGLYTAPTDEALKYDIEITKRLGFNMIRKHVKVEPDSVVLLVRHDGHAGLAGHARRRQSRTTWPSKQFAVELERMIDALRNHPSIVMWVPFNEGWGQHETPAVRRLDQEVTTRLAAGQQRQRLDRHGHGRRRRHAQLSRPRHAADRKEPRCGAGRVRRPGTSRQGPSLGRTRTTGAIARSAPGKIWAAPMRL